jgi:xylose dehydrogenase (NAD/NADP)
MSEKIRWGILSTANIGRKRVAPAIQNSRNGRVLAVASRDRDRARAYAEELNIPKYYGSYEELLADPEIDAIYIPLPNHMHADWSIRCADAGKPVLCEKPLASDAAEAQALVAAMEKRGVLFAEAFMYRDHPQTQRVKSMVDNGAVGEVEFIRASFTFQVRSETNIRLRADMAGGALMDVGCYCVNVMRFMTGEEPAEVSALARFGERSRVDEYLAGIMRFPSGVLGHLDCGLRTFGDHSYEIRGSKGRILVEQGFVMAPGADMVIRHWHEDTYQEITIDGVNHYQIMAEEFADSLIKGTPVRFPIQDAVHNMQVIDRLQASARAVP